MLTTMATAKFTGVPKIPAEIFVMPRMFQLGLSELSSMYVNVVTKPAIMPATAPRPFARFQKIPRTRIGKRVDAANENAHATSCTIIPRRRTATSAASTAAISTAMRLNNKRVCGDAPGFIVCA